MKDNLNLYTLAARELLRRSRRSVFTVSGVALSAGLLIFSLTVVSSLRGSFSRALGSVGADIVVQTHGEPCVWAPVKLPTNLNPIPVQTLQEARGMPEVAKASGVLVCWAFNGEKGNLHPTVIAGVEPLETELGPLKLSDSSGEGNVLVAGRYLNDLDVYATVVSDDFAQFMQAAIGSQIFFGDKKFDIVGTINIGREARISGAQAFIPLRAAQELLKRGDVIDTVFIKLKRQADPAATAFKLQKLFGPHATVTTSLDFPSMITGISALALVSMLGLLVCVLVVSLFFSMRSIQGAVSERSKEISIMKAVGWRQPDIRNLIAIECFMAGAAGSVIGTTAGALLARVYLQSLQMRLPGILASYPPCSAMLAHLDIKVYIPPLDIPAAAAVILTLTALSVISGVISARGLGRIECAQGMRGL